ncbi:hypothetical protein BaRGS_00014944, partial [Batillaria attramentaria]
SRLSALTALFIKRPTLHGVVNCLYRPVTQTRGAAAACNTERRECRTGGGEGVRDGEDGGRGGEVMHAVDQTEPRRVKYNWYTDIFSLVKDTKPRYTTPRCEGEGYGKYETALLKTSRLLRQSSVKEIQLVVSFQVNDAMRLCYSLWKREKDAVIAIISVEAFCVIRSILVSFVLGAAMESKWLKSEVNGTVTQRPCTL